MRPCLKQTTNLDFVPTSKLCWVLSRPTLVIIFYLFVFRLCKNFWIEILPLFVSRLHFSLCQTAKHFIHFTAQSLQMLRLKRKILFCLLLLINIQTEVNIYCELKCLRRWHGELVLPGELTVRSRGHFGSPLWLWQPIITLNVTKCPTPGWGVRL